MVVAPWSISGRITKWFVFMTVAMALAMAGVSAWFLRYSLEREVTALIEEEFEELGLLVRDRDPTHEELARFVAQLQSEHRSNAMAFRVWRNDGGAPEDFGRVEFLEPELPAREVARKTQRAPGNLRWRTQPVGERFVIGMIVDGTAQLSLFGQFWLASLGLVGLSAVTALVGGAIVIRKSRRLLDEVAERARSARWSTSDQALHVEGAPEEIQNISDALETMRNNIRQEAERARLLATGMAHELSSPIQNLVVQSEVALMRDRSNADFRRLIVSQLDELRDLAHAVGNLVALCSMDVSATTEDLEEFDLAQEIELRLRRERVRAEARGVALDVRCTGDLTLRGDREALLLALCNLVSNAIDWSPSGGRVEVAAEQVKDRIEILVDDSGPGIPEELRDKVFQPFFRGPAARGRRVGYGLGLSIARAAIEAQSGSISVDRSQNGGARLRVSLARGAG